MSDRVVGREEELRVASEFVEEIERGAAALAFEGEPGIGKTTLWRAAAVLAEERGCRVMVSRPAAPERRLSFAALADLVGAVEAEVFARLPSPQRLALDVALLRAESERGIVDPRAVSAAVLSLVTALALDARVVLAIDDVQWLDPPSARALQFVVRRLDRRRVGVLVSARVGESGRAVDLISALDRGWTKRIQIGPLTLAATQQMLKQRLGCAFRRPTLLRIHQASRGNPFFALEIAWELGSAEVRPEEPLPVPADVRMLVRRRIERLPKDTRDALLRLAVLSEPRAEMLGGSLEAALACGMVAERTDGRIAFTHPLYGSAVYELAAPDERRRVHRALAAQVEDVEERARHLGFATTETDAQVASQLERAAERARSRGAPEAAAELQELALELTPLDESRAAERRALAAAEDHFHAGALGRSRALLTATLERLQTPTARVRALRLLAKVRFRDESIPNAIELLRGAALEAGADPELRTSVELDLCYALNSLSVHPDPIRTHTDALLRYAERQPDSALLAEALALAEINHLLLGDGVDEARLARALALEDPERSVPVERRPTLIAGVVAFYIGDFAYARSLLYPLRARLRERGEEGELADLLGNMAWLECWAGDLAAATILAEEALESGLVTEGETVEAAALAFAALVDAHAGRIESCRTRVAAAGPVLDRIGYGLAAMFIPAALGLLELALGNARAAARVFEPLTRFVEANGLLEPVRHFYLPDAIEALVAVGQLERAERLTGMLAARGRELDRPWAIATGARCRALALGARQDIASALAALEEALAAHRRLSMPLELARTLLVKGQVERRAKRKAAAKKSFQDALSIFDDRGSQLWAERARAELARVSRRRASAGDLTESEQRVAELAATGLTNREVAAQLFMSPKTVEVNLARAYRKLGIRSRAELGARLTPPGQVPA